WSGSSKAKSPSRTNARAPAAMTVFVKLHHGTNAVAPVVDTTSPLSMTTEFSIRRLVSNFGKQRDEVVTLGIGFSRSCRISRFTEGIALAYLENGAFLGLCAN